MRVYNRITIKVSNDIIAMQSHRSENLHLSIFTKLKSHLVAHDLRGKIIKYIRMYASFIFFKHQNDMKTHNL